MRRSTNTGAVDIEEDHGGSRTIEGSITSEKTVLITAGATLKLTGSYTQGKKGTLEIGINSASSFGVLSATGPASINGTLSLVVAKTFKGSLGQKYGILTSSGLTGTFPKEKKAAISKSSPEGLYYKPVYSGTGVTLQVVGITLTPTPTEGAPSSTVTLSGEGYPAEDTVTLTFTDHAKHKTTLTSVKTGVGGTFSTRSHDPARRRRRGRDVRSQEQRHRRENQGDLQGHLIDRLRKSAQYAAGRRRIAVFSAPAGAYTNKSDMVGEEWSSSPRTRSSHDTPADRRRLDPDPLAGHRPVRGRARWVTSSDPSARPSRPPGMRAEQVAIPEHGGGRFASTESGTRIAA